VSQDPSHDGVDKSGVDEGDVVEVRLVPEFEGGGSSVCTPCVCALTAPDVRWAWWSAM
jgi:hypothetical protein